jgi:hypothetical protein
MQAPLSNRVRKILEDKTLARQLMEGVLLGINDSASKNIIKVDGKNLRIVRVSEMTKSAR